MTATDKGLPWGILRIGNIYQAGIKTNVIYPAGIVPLTGRTGRWVQAVPLEPSPSIPERVRAAWWVLTGRAHALVWPKDGELEEAVDPLP